MYAVSKAPDLAVASDEKWRAKALSDKLRAKNSYGRFGWRRSKGGPLKGPPT